MAAKPCDIAGFDAHGFAIFLADGVTGSTPDTERCHDYRDMKYSEENMKSWEDLLQNWDDSKLDFKVKLDLMQSGVPAKYRPQLWKLLLDVESLKLCNSFHYKEQIERVREQLVELGISEFSGDNGVTQLCEVEEEQHEVKPGQISMHALRHIMLDLDRTYPTHRMFLNRSGEGKEGRACLFRVLAAYARYNSTVEYCQGMSSIAGMFVMYLSEEDAFWCLVSLLERNKYLVGYFSVEMSRLRKHAEVFDKLLYQRMPELQRHLERCGVNTLMYVTPWFLCLFTSLACWDSVLAMWDLLLLDGHRTLFRVGLAIMSLCEQELLVCSDMSQLLPKLLRLPVHVIQHSTLIPKIHQTIVEDWEVNCLLSIIDGEEREANENAAHLHNGGENLRLGTLRLRGQKRKGSASSNNSDGSLFLFLGTETRKTKRQRTDTDTPSKPSFLARIKNMFNRDGTRTPKDNPRKSLRRRKTPTATLAVDQSKSSIRKRRKSSRRESCQSNSRTPKAIVSLFPDADAAGRGSPSKRTSLPPAVGENTIVLRRSPRGHKSTLDQSRADVGHSNVAESQMFTLQPVSVPRQPLQDSTNKVAPVDQKGPCQKVVNTDTDTARSFRSFFRLGRNRSEPIQNS